MSKSNNTLPPGTPTPGSGIYEQVGPRGGPTGEQADSTRGILSRPPKSPDIAGPWFSPPTIRAKSKTV
jgi:hypothetical protein